MAEIQDDGYLERIKDFFAEQAERKLQQDMMMIEAQRAAVEKLTPTAAQAAYLGAQFAPLAGGVDAAGRMASFPSSEVGIEDAFSGEPMPSLAENLGEGRYFDAGLQSLGMVGDAAMAIPFVGPVAAGVLKAPKIVKSVLTAQRVGKDIDQGIGALPRSATTLKVVPDSTLPKEMAEIETRFTKQLNEDLDGAIDQYRNLPDSDGGRIINTDLARELSPDYVADRTMSAAVHEPASAFTKAYYAKLLAEPAAPGKFDEVLFTGGGTGAGKSTALEDALLEKTVRSQIVYDTNLAGFPSSMKKIDEALDAGKDVTVAYVYRDPIEALTGGGEFGGGAVQRAKRMGRTVPVNIHVGTHVRSIETVKDLAKHYEGNPNVDIRVIDNTGGKGKAFDAGNDLSGLPEYDYNELLKEATDELVKARKEGWLPQKLYEGFVPAKTGS
jgi:hypothetical protein